MKQLTRLQEDAVCQYGRILADLEDENHNLRRRLEELEDAAAKVQYAHHDTQPDDYPEYGEFRSRSRDREPAAPHAYDDDCGVSSRDDRRSNHIVPKDAVIARDERLPLHRRYRSASASPHDHRAPLQRRHGSRGRGGGHQKAGQQADYPVRERQHRRPSPGERPQHSGRGAPTPRAPKRSRSRSWRAPPQLERRQQQQQQQQQQRTPPPPEPPPRPPAVQQSPPSHRSPSRSPEQLHVRMPHNAAAEEESGQVYRAEIIERPAVGGGSIVYQAEITMPQLGVSHSGRQRVFTMRGPPRKSREQAENEATQLTNASIEGARAVRVLANAMHRVS